MIIQFMVALVATVSFAILFSAPKSQYLFCALTGAIGWLTYLLFTQQLDLGTGVSSLFATLILTIVSRAFSTLRRQPVTIFLIPGIFALVPGAGIYYTSYYLIMNEVDAFTSKGVETFKIAGAIAFGIIFGLGIPQKFFSKLQTLSLQRKK